MKKKPTKKCTNCKKTIYRGEYCTACSKANFDKKRTKQRQEVRTAQQVMQHDGQLQTLQIEGNPIKEEKKEEAAPQEKSYSCSSCGKDVSKNIGFCPHCGKELDWSGLL
jgi:predicted amidophosphoribosyltransferase